MKQTKPKPSDKELDQALLSHYKANSQRLHQIAANVWQYGEEGDDTVDCVFRKMFDVTWDTAFYDGEDEPCAPDLQSSASVETLMKMFGMKS
jgi:hypothetical protein